jgi:hypothetical protein
MRAAAAVGTCADTSSIAFIRHAKKGVLGVLGMRGGIRAHLANNPTRIREKKRRGKLQNFRAESISSSSYTLNVFLERGRVHELFEKFGVSDGV